MLTTVLNFPAIEVVVSKNPQLRQAEFRSRETVGLNRGRGLVIFECQTLRHCFDFVATTYLVQTDLTMNLMALSSVDGLVWVFQRFWRHHEGRLL